MEQQPQRKRRFPFFTIPAPKFLFADLKKVDDFVVMLRLTPKITIDRYIDRTLYLICFIFFSFSIVLAVLSIVLNTPILALLRFIQRNGWRLIEYLSGATIPPDQLNGMLYLWCLFFLFVGMIWILSHAKKAIRDFLGLIRLHRMTPEERAKFALREFLNISLPIWLSPSITYEPTAEQLLKVVRERGQAVAGQIQAIAAELAREQQAGQEEEETFRMFLTLTDRLLFTLLGSDGEQLTVELNDAEVPLVSFLATRPRGEWIAREVFFDMDLYGEEQDNLFKKHRDRTNDHINGQIVAKAQEKGVLLQSTTESTFSEIDLFENEKQGQNSFWRLLPDCGVEIFPFLSAFFLKVTRAQALPEDSSLLSLEDLQSGCDHLMQEYGDGFLSKHMKKDLHVWFWAFPLCQEYREQCLVILNYALARQGEHLATLSETKDRQKSINRIAQLHGWIAIVTVGLELQEQDPASEEELSESLSLYKQTQNRAPARKIYRRYQKLRSQIDPSYEPGEALQALVDELFTVRRRSTRPKQ
jgi:hypothetical protein